MMSDTPAATSEGQMYESGALGARGDAFGNPSNDFQQSADDLRHLATQLEKFLLQQLDRLEHELVSVAVDVEGGDVDKLMAEFQAVREAWEQEKDAERERIQDDSQRLAEAWERLEKEQRELLKQRATQRLTSGSASNAKAVGTASPERQRQQASSTAKKNVANAAGASGNAGHKNQLQFQQLRREMLEHARRRRKR